jgi:hypothetical protein
MCGQQLEDKKVCKWKGSPASILEYQISNMRGDLAAISINNYKNDFTK